MPSFGRLKILIAITISLKAKGLKGDLHLLTYREENQVRKISRTGSRKKKMTMMKLMLEWVLLENENKSKIDQLFVKISKRK